MEISKAVLDEVARKLSARLQFLQENPGAARGNVACFGEAQAKKRLGQQGAIGNVVYLAAKTAP